jgi:hypothetical protein
VVQGFDGGNDARLGAGTCCCPVPH